MRLIVPAWFLLTFLLAACGTDQSVLYKATPADATPTAASTAEGGVSTAIEGTAIAPAATIFTGDSTTLPAPPVASATPVPPTATSTPGPAGQTGIAGVVTIGPTCPVQRIDSPCPDRPYEALITVWQGATKVGETRSGADGRYVIELPPGSYRVVGESPGTLPRGSEQQVVVEAGRIAIVNVQYDSGIR